MGLKPGLIQAVKRNIKRFPSDFMFQLTAEETEYLRSQFVTSNKGLKEQVTAVQAERLRSQFVILKKGRGIHSKYLSYAFTEQGVAMLSSVLRSDRAVRVNIEIMRAFVRLDGGGPGWGCNVNHCNTPFPLAGGRLGWG